MHAVTPYSILLALGAVQGIFLALAVATSKQRKIQANRFLVFLLLVFVLDLIDEFTLATGYYRLAPQLTAINWAVDLLFGPVIYLYTRATTRNTCYPSNTSSIFLHFLPFIIAISVVLIMWKLVPAQQFSAQVNGDGIAILAYCEATMIIGGIFSIALYISFSLRQLRSHQLAIGDHYSYTNNVNLRWLRNLLYALSSLYFLYILTAIVEIFTPIKYFESLSLYPAMVLTIYIMGFLGLKQPRIFMESSTLDETSEQFSQSTLALTAEGNKYAKSAISSEQSKLLLHDIRLTMESHQLFLDGTLSLPSLAAKLRLSPNSVSQAINEAAGINFFDFVNQYRIQFAQQLLCNTSDNVLDIAMNAGFNSKTAFYSAFKKHTNRTPRQYRSDANTVAECDR